MLVLIGMFIFDLLGLDLKLDCIISLFLVISLVIDGNKFS